MRCILHGQVFSTGHLLAVRSVRYIRLQLTDEELAFTL